ncbi:hypothetical protein F5Y15DRAFT_413331 [Xylariaceae sp. FL0016]|nr:hypothetical protein F5Y15DRAFT_413331 [Xylariaceae sp. FL0016]
MEYCENDRSLPTYPRIHDNQGYGTYPVYQMETPRLDHGQTEASSAVDPTPSNIRLDGFHLNGPNRANQTIPDSVVPLSSNIYQNIYDYVPDYDIWSNEPPPVSSGIAIPAAHDEEIYLTHNSRPQRGRAMVISQSSYTLPARQPNLGLSIHTSIATNSQKLSFSDPPTPDGVRDMSLSPTTANDPRWNEFLAAFTVPQHLFQEAPQTPGIQEQHPQPQARPQQVQTQERYQQDPQTSTVIQPYLQPQAPFLQAQMQRSQMQRRYHMQRQY